MRHYPEPTVLITSGTVTSAELLQRRLRDGAFARLGLSQRLIHQFLPMDRPQWVAAFLDHWRPSCAIWTESELWPCLLTEVQHRKIPAALVNARMSERSAGRWRLLDRAAKRLLDSFGIILAQNQDEAQRLSELAGRPVEFVGNLKFANPPPPVDEEELTRLKSHLGDRPCWLLASSHPGEDDVAIQIHRQLLPDHEDILTIIAPRHPERAEHIVEMSRKANLEVARRSEGTLPALWHDIYLCDTIGELGLMYRLAQTVCIGGSLVDIGGHNPIEPAQLGCAIVVGRHMYNFSAVNMEMKVGKALRQVPDADMMLHAISEFLGDASLRAAFGQRAADIAAHHRDVLDRVDTALAPILESAALGQRHTLVEA